MLRPDPDEGRARESLTLVGPSRPRYRRAARRQTNGTSRLPARAWVRPDTLLAVKARGDDERAARRPSPRRGDARAGLSRCPLGGRLSKIKHGSWEDIIAIHAAPVAHGHLTTADRRPVRRARDARRGLPGGAAAPGPLIHPGTEAHLDVALPGRRLRFPGWPTLEKWNVLDAVPERMPLLGYYREGDPSVMDWQIKWAVEHGIAFFAFMMSTA